MKRAFTLIELLIVLSVISILVGIALPRFRGMQEEAKSSRVAGELRSLTTAIESYYIHNSREYPSQTGASTVSTNWQSVITAAAPQIIGTALTDPFKPSQQYSYGTNAASGSKYYVIFSVGPDAGADITGITAGGGIGTPDDDVYFCNSGSGKVVF